MKTARPAARPRRREKEHHEMKDFGPRLRALRGKRGLTQEDVARALGTSWVIVSRYERGLHLPTASKVVALARILRVTADALLRGDRQGEEPMEFRNVRLYERMRVLDKLPRMDQDTVLDVIDAVIARREVETVVEQRRAAR